MTDATLTTARARSVRTVLESVRAFTDAVDQMHTGLRGDMDMNATDLSALRMLTIREQRGQLVKPHDLARHLGISSASTTKLLDRLAADGLIQRRPHPHDRRALIIVLTDSAREDFVRHFGGHMARMRAALEPYSDAELEVVARFLDDLGEALVEE